MGTGNFLLKKKEKKTKKKKEEKRKKKKLERTKVPPMVTQRCHSEIVKYKN